jgi:hypothetical protein
MAAAQKNFNFSELRDGDSVTGQWRELFGRRGPRIRGPVAANRQRFFHWSILGRRPTRRSKARGTTRGRRRAERGDHAPSRRVKISAQRVARSSDSPAGEVAITLCNSPTPWRRGEPLLFSRWRVAAGLRWSAWRGTAAQRGSAARHGCGISGASAARQGLWISGGRSSAG